MVETGCMVKGFCIGEKSCAQFFMPYGQVRIYYPGEVKVRNISSKENFGKTYLIGFLLKTDQDNQTSAC
jgi:hypothetical protein